MDPPAFKKHSKTMIEAGMVYSGSQCRVRGGMEDVLDLYEEPYDPASSGHVFR
jgi:hypothetical protein